MGDALIVRRGGSGGSSSSGNWKLKTKIYTADKEGYFTVPKAVGQRFEIRLFGGGGGALGYFIDGRISRWIQAGGGGGMMNNASLILNEGDKIYVTPGKGGEAIQNVNFNNINFNNSFYAGNGTTTSFGTYLRAKGGIGAKISKGSSNSNYWFTGGNGGAGGGSSNNGGDGYQFGGGAGGNSAGWGGEFGGGGGTNNSRKNQGGIGGVIFNLETLNYTTFQLGGVTTVRNSGYGGNGGSYNNAANNGTNTINLLLNAKDNISSDCLGAGITSGVASGGGGYGGNGGRVFIPNNNTYIGAGGGGGYGADGGNANYFCFGGGGGYGKGGYGGGITEDRNVSQVSKYNIGISGGGGSYGHGGTAKEEPTFGGGGSSINRNGSITAQNGADGICIIQYYVEE